MKQSDSPEEYTAPEKSKSFEEELTYLINRHSVEKEKYYV